MARQQMYRKTAPANDAVMPRDTRQAIAGYTEALLTELETAILDPRDAIARMAGYAYSCGITDAILEVTP